MIRIANALVADAPVIVAGAHDPAKPVWRDLTADTGFRDLDSMLHVDGAHVDWTRLWNQAAPVPDSAPITYRTLTAPSSRIFCAGFNYAAPGRPRPDYPTLFLRTSQSLVAHRADVIRPRMSAALDWEGELGVVIGSPARHIPPERAWDCIAGFTALSDNTVRDYAKHGTQATAGKNFERSGAIGPWMVPAAEMPALDTVRVTTRVNGTTVQSAPVTDLLIPVADLISYLSSVLTLLPGDVIATGTPAGIGARQDPPRFLVAGDLVEVDITGIGVLANRVADEEPTGR